jgi:hypothetical protein
MIRELVVRRRALAEIQHARNEYSQLGHGGRFFDDLELVLEATRAMPLRFPIVYGEVRVLSCDATPTRCSSGSGRSR